MVSLSDEQRKSIVHALREWLGEDGISFFREMQRDHGRVDPILWFEYGGGGFEPPQRFPHSVHFREGMQVRNFLRTLPETEGWDAHDYDGQWKPLVESALKVRISEEAK